VQKSSTVFWATPAVLRYTGGSQGNVQTQLIHLLQKL